MELKHIFKASAVTAALALAGCGGDINVTPTTIDNSSTTVTDSNNTTNNNGGDNGGTTNVCASYSENDVLIQGEFDATNSLCTYTDAFVSVANPLTADITLDASVNHFFQSSLVVGEDCNTTQGCTVEVDGPTLTVEAGATVVFDNASSRVQINRGANIIANGTLRDPITFTSANTIPALDLVGAGPSPQDWGGVMIDGFGITDQCSDDERAAGTCNAQSEGAVSFYGGNDNADSSGVLRFVKIHFAGGLPAGADLGDDLNSLSLFAVGSGTTIDYIDIYAGYDDGIELFGGAVDLKHIVVTDTQDDSIDIDAGWQGNAQYMFIKHGSLVNASGQRVNMGNGAFESDGEKGDTTAEAPASAPYIANVTVVTTDERSVRDIDESIAIKLDDNIEAKWYNTVIKKMTGDTTWCINVSSDAAASVAASTTNINNSAIACATLAQPEQLASVTAWLEADGRNNAILNGTDTVLAANGYQTAADLSDLVTAADMTTVVEGSFFEATDYIGAVSPADTSSDWARWVQAAFVNADDE